MSASVARGSVASAGRALSPGARPAPAAAARTAAGATAAIGTRAAACAPRRRALLGGLVGTFAAAVLPRAARGAAPRTLLVLGDSLSAEYGLPRGAGWVALLEKRVVDRRPPVRVVNASVSGETTSGGRTRLPDLLARHAPAWVVIELGGNDALRGLPLAGTEQNLREMVRAAKAAGAKPLVLGMRMPPNYGRAYAEQFEAVFRRVAETERVPLVPFFLEAFGENVEYFQPDRIHPAQKAQPLMLEAVWPTLSKLL